MFRRIEEDDKEEEKEEELFAFLFDNSASYAYLEYTPKIFCTYSIMEIMLCHNFFAVRADLKFSKQNLCNNKILVFCVIMEYLFSQHGVTLI